MTTADSAERVCPQCGQVCSAEVCPSDGSRTLAAASPDLASPGEVIGGRYRIVGKVGEGGFGQVYAAEHTQTAHKVAIKVLRDHPSAPAVAIARFAQEAKVCGQLRSPHTVRIADHGATDAGRLYIAMEFLAGESLSARLRRVGKLPAREAVHIAVQVLRSLQEAHSLGLVHRDLKPDNILLCDVVGAPDFVKVIDFGVAKLCGREDGQDLTRTGVVVGTPHYMSPEQVQAAAVDGRADLYALGVVLFECLCGRVPFAGESALASCLAHLTEPPPAFRQCDGPADVVLEGLVQRALAKRPQDRFATAVDMATGLEAWLARARVGEWAPIVTIVEAGQSQVGVVDTTDEWLPTSPLRATPAPPSTPSATPISRQEPPNATPVVPERSFRWPWVAALALFTLAPAVWVGRWGERGNPPAGVTTSGGAGAALSPLPTVMAQPTADSLPQAMAESGAGNPVADSVAKNAVIRAKAVAPTVAPVPAAATASAAADSPTRTAGTAPSPPGKRDPRPAPSASAKACAQPAGSRLWCLSCPQASTFAAGTPPDCACRQTLAIGIGDATWCACFPSHTACAARCAHARGSLAWCESCPDAKLVTPTGRDGCACRRAQGVLRPGDADWCVCFPRDLVCGTPTGCDAIRLSPQWCRNCAKAKLASAYSPDWCQCRKALGDDVRGSDIWCRCFPTDSHCPQDPNESAP